MFYQINMGQEKFCATQYISSIAVPLTNDLGIGSHAKIEKVILEFF